MAEDKKYFIGQTLISENYGEVTFVLDDGDLWGPTLLVLDSENTQRWEDRVEVKPTNKFTFAQVIQGLLEGYFEDGTEFKVNGNSVFASKSLFSGLGLVKEKHDARVEMEIGASLINATWELVVPEEPIKELTLNELEEILGHKVKIKNND